MRTGIIAEKIGMTRVFNTDGRQVSITLLKVSPNVVLESFSQETRGYTALKLGSIEATKVQRLTKPIRGYFSKQNIDPKLVIREFRVDSASLLEPGTEINADHFQAGQYIDVSGFTIGKGFAGVIKRHRFGGLRASHGVSVSHRSHGSTGNRQDPGKVFKNKKMAGHMGDRQRTQQNLTVHSIDSENGLLYVSGSVPGAKGAIILVRDAVKKNQGTKA
ncbi:MAG: 50S ribosomal protein L3 [Alphaproteobacteria bacterium]